MSILTRFTNVIQGIIRLFVKDFEMQNPEAVYEQAIAKQIEKFNRARAAVAAIVSERQQTEARLSKSQAELAQVEADLEAALATDQDDLAELLVQKQEQLQAAIAGFTTDLQRVSKEAEEAKGMLTQFKGEIDRLKSEKNTMVARHQTAQARIAIQDQLDGLSVEAEMAALTSVREGINRTVAQADLNSELASTNVDNRLAKLRQTAGATSAKAKVAALKAQRAEAATKSL